MSIIHAKEGRIQTAVWVRVPQKYWGKGKIIMLRIFSKIIKGLAFVALTLLVRIYDSWGASTLPSAGMSAAVMIGMGAPCSYAISCCSSLCSKMGYGFTNNYYGNVQINGTTSTYCLCLTTSGAFGSKCYTGNNACYGQGAYYASLNGTYNGYSFFRDFTCSRTANVTCSQTNTWTSYSNGQRRQVYRGCNSGTGACVDSDSLYNWRCTNDYYAAYKSASTAGNTCTKCPSSVYGATSISGHSVEGTNSVVTDCFAYATTTSASDTTGTFVWTSSCYSCGASQPTCRTNNNCFSSGYTSCTTQGCCTSSCGTYVCDPTNQNFYTVSAQCYAHNYTSCVNNCCTSYCTTTLCGLTSGIAYVFVPGVGMDYAVDCRNVGYNNDAECINNCCSGLKCASAYGGSGNTTGRCTSDLDCATDTSSYDYSCDTSLGCCIRSTVCSKPCINGSCTTYGSNYLCNVDTNCCTKNTAIGCLPAQTTCNTASDCYGGQEIPFNCICQCNNGTCSCAEGFNPVEL